MGASPIAVIDSSGGESSFSGSLGLDYNSHFISYGADVWGAGSDVDDVLFNPSVELTWDLGAGTTFSLGTWWDVNDNADSDIGDSIQEVDVWAGLGWSMGGVDMSLTYQSWLYASDNEQIVDLGLGFDAVFAPSLTVHGRVAEGASGGDTGVVVVGGIDLLAAEAISFGDFSLGIPVNVAYASDGFHGGDSGFAYASIGLSASAPLGGGWDIHGGATYYYTNDSVIPNNASDSFVTLSAGLGFSF